MEQAGLKSSLIFLFRKTSFVYGMTLGFALFSPYLLEDVIKSQIQLMLICVAIVFFGTMLCGNWAVRKFKKLNDILYVDMDPDRFLELFVRELYSSKPEKWRGAALVYAAQAYHMQGSFKQEEALYLKYLNEDKKRLSGRLTPRDDFAVLGRMVILYGDAENAAGAQKAFDKFREIAANIEPVLGDDEYKDFIYNCYLKGVGRYSDCVGFFEWHCDKRPNELCTLASHFRLAEVYKALGSAEEAERECRIVAETGKNTYAAREARRYLGYE